MQKKCLTFHWNVPSGADIYCNPRIFQEPSVEYSEPSVGIFLEGFGNMLCYLGSNPRFVVLTKQAFSAKSLKNQIQLLLTHECRIDITWYYFWGEYCYCQEEKWWNTIWNRTVDMIRTLKTSNNSKLQ